MKTAIPGFAEHVHCRVRWRVACTAALLLASESAVGFEPTPKLALQIHGFLTQGYFLTSVNNMFGTSNHRGSLDFTEIGLNGSWELTPQVRIAAQLLSRRAGRGSEGRIGLDYGLLDYTAIDNNYYNAGLRVGRVRLPYGGFWNDARDVAFARPSILLPQSIYSDVLRSTFISGDGAEVHGNLFTAAGDFNLQLVGYYPRVDDRELEAGLVFQDYPGGFSGRPSFMGRLLYEYKHSIKLGISGGFNKLKYQPASPNDLLPGYNDYSFIVVSGQYVLGRWSFTAEYKRQNVRNSGFNRQDLDGKNTGEGYYAQVTYRPTERWEAVARYDVAYSDVNDRDGTQINQLQLLPRHVNFGKDWTVGLRFDITRDLMVRAEYHRVFGTTWVSPLDNPLENVGQSRANWDIFSILFSYRF